MNLLQRFSLVLFGLSLSTFSHARLLQIIHTNDLHSYFNGYYTGMGGYGRVMTKIKELKAEAASKGIEVLQLDAGDWGEGTSFFHSDQGADSIRAINLLGTEVAAVGNHDFQLGGTVLGKQIRAAGVSTKFVAANLDPTPEMDLKNDVLSHVDLERAGIKIRVVGLTTNEPVFEYAMAPGEVHSPYSIGEELAKKGKEEGRELVIALTHIGQSSDKYLAQSSSSIDVIVGGHTHTKLTEIDWEKNKLGNQVPIVQAWAHGLAVGTLLLDVKDDGKVEVVEYKLHEIGLPLLSDPDMQAFVDAAALKRNDVFSGMWDEVIGETKTAITGYIQGEAVYRSSCWGHHFATAARRAVGASLGIHISNFEGVYKPAGPVTKGDVMDSFPHFRKYGDQGWEIATVFMSGWKLRPLLYYISRQGYGITLSGMGYKTIEDIPVDDKATYRIAFPAEVALAVKTSLPQYRQYLSGLKYTGKYYWPVMIEHVKKHTPISCH